MLSGWKCYRNLWLLSKSKQQTFKKTRINVAIGGEIVLNRFKVLHSLKKIKNNLHFYLNFSNVVYKGGNTDCSFLKF